MAESSWPSPSDGRSIDDAEYEKLGISYGSIAGVFGDFTSPQLIYADSTGMQIKVAADRYALVRGHEWYSGSVIFTKPIGSNASGSTRTDLVVLRLSRTTWEVTVVVIPGTPGAGAPSPTQQTGTTGNWDLPLATVTVANGAATISAANVTYVATHLMGDGSYRIPTEGAASYVPHPFSGMEVRSPDGTIMRYNGSAFAQKYGWLPYVPTWTAASGTTGVGSGGVCSGRYLQLGKLVHLEIYLLLGTSPSLGTGGWNFSLPVNMTSTANIMAIGSAYFRDASAGASGHFTGVARIQPSLSNTTVQVFNVNQQVTGTVPFTWVATDFMAMSITYEAA